MWGTLYERYFMFFISRWPGGFYSFSVSPRIQKYKMFSTRLCYRSKCTVMHRTDEFIVARRLCYFCTRIYVPILLNTYYSYTIKMEKKNVYANSLLNLIIRNNIIVMQLSRISADSLCIVHPYTCSQVPGEQ